MLQLLSKMLTRKGIDILLQLCLDIFNIETL